MLHTLPFSSCGDKICKVIFFRSLRSWHDFYLQYLEHIVLYLQTHLVVLGADWLNLRIVSAEKYFSRLLVLIVPDP